MAPCTGGESAAAATPSLPGRPPHHNICRSRCSSISLTFASLPFSHSPHTSVPYPSSALTPAIAHDGPATRYVSDQRRVRGKCQNMRPLLREIQSGDRLQGCLPGSRAISTPGAPQPCLSLCSWRFTVRHPESSTPAL